MTGQEGPIPGSMNPGGRGKFLNPKGTEDLILIHGPRRVDKAAFCTLRSPVKSPDGKQNPEGSKHFLTITQLHSDGARTHAGLSQDPRSCCALHHKGECVCG